MNILFIGCVESSAVELELLLKNKKNVVGIITKERSTINADFFDLAPIGERHNIPVHYAKNINSIETQLFIKERNPDIAYCFGWSQIISKEILEIPRLGVIGTHPTKLPYNRGRHPIIWALCLGLNETASTFFFMNEGADTGDIISQKEIVINYSDYAQDLYDRITKAECEQILEFTEALENNTYKRIKQDINVGNLWRKRGKQDGIIDWRMSSRAIYNLVRALSHPYIGAEFEYGNNKYKVWRCEEVIDASFENIEPGKIIKYASKNDFYVKAYDNIVHIYDCDDFEGEEGIYL